MSVTIHDFKYHWAADFASLNYEWIAKYFLIERHDREILDNPQKYVIDPGGRIFMAIHDASQNPEADTGNEVNGAQKDASQNLKAVGTVALIPAGQGNLELTKMAVSPEFQGQGIANLLMQACIDFASQNGVRTVFLESHRSLGPALALYKKYGFVETPTDPNSEYARADIRMERSFVA